MNANARPCVLIALSALVFCGESALAQTQQLDAERLQREGVERNDAAARAHGFEMERQRQERERQAEDSRRSQSQSSTLTGGGYTPPPSGGNSAGTGRGAAEMSRLPPLPAERNVLLGNWRVESGSQGAGVTGLGQGKGTDRNAMARELLTAVSNPCVLMFGNGITFAPSTYSIQALDGSVFRGSVDYRSTQKQVILAMTQETWKTLPFEIEGPNRIVWGRFGCALVRVGAPAPAPPPSTLSRPSPEVCRNTLIDKLGTVGTNQVRAMSDVRFKEPAIEGKVPNTNNLRIDLRGSACDDPRLKATLYDFDANDMLQSITYVWDRPAGPAPAPIFNERARLLANWYAPGPAQSPSRWQGTSTAARVTLQDVPERALLLEAYAAPR